MNYLYKYILEMKIRPEGPGLVPERGQLLLLLRNHVFKLLGVRCRNKVEVFVDMNMSELRQLTVLVVVDLVGHGKEGGVLLDPVLHRVHQVLVGLHHVFLQNLEAVISDTFCQILNIAQMNIG